MDSIIEHALKLAPTMAKKKDLTFHLINYNSSIKLARI